MAVFTFDTTHHALWAEEVAGDEGIPVEVIPAPPQFRARCDIALLTSSATADRLHSVLTEAGVPHRLEADPPGET